MRPGTERDLIDRLVDDVHPVRPLWSPGRRFGIWVAYSLVWPLLFIAGRHRYDLPIHLDDPFYVAELVALWVLAALLAAEGLRMAVPGLEPGRRLRLAAVAMGVVVVLLRLLAHQGPDISLAAFALRGCQCVLTLSVFAAVPWAALLAAQRRAAPLAPGWAGALAGGAAWVFALLLSRLVCPLDDRIHVIVWHLLPVAGAAALSAVAGRALLERWRLARRPA